MTEVTSAPRRNQAKPLPPLEVLDEFLSYTPETGVFRWRRNMSNRRPTGSIAGNVNARGYRYIGMGGIRYLAHRLAFKMHHRREPDGEVDHQDTNPTNNRISNLREASRSGNGCNKRLESKNTSGVKGVFWNSRNRRWQAKVQIRSKQIHVGYFKTIEEAAAAIRPVRESAHGEFANHGSC